MQIEMMKTADLIPYVNNPRNNDAAVDAVASSIKNFGFKVPIVIDSENEIITGHTRLKAAKKLGMDEVPVIRADDLTPAQVKAFRLADNKVAELAEWDFDTLAEELEVLSDDFDMSEFGFVDDAGGDDLPEDTKLNVDDLTKKLPESRVMICTISTFGTDSEAFCEIPLPQETANYFLDHFYTMDPEKVAEKIRETINAL